MAGFSDHWQDWLRQATGAGEAWQAQTLRALARQLDGAESMVRSLAPAVPGAGWNAAQAAALAATLGGAGRPETTRPGAGAATPGAAAGDEPADERARFTAAGAALQARLGALAAGAAADLQAQLAVAPAADLGGLFERWVSCYEARLREQLLDPEFARHFGAAVNSALALHRAAAHAPRVDPSTDVHRLQRRLQRLARRVERLGG